MRLNSLIIGLFMVSFICCNQLYGQISKPSTPYSFTHPDVGEEVHQVALPSPNLFAIQEEDKQDAKDNVPPRFGYPLPANYNLKNSGTWTELPNGGRLWRLKISCPTALSINLNYNDFWLPIKAKLHIYNESRTQILGAYTSRNNKANRQFATSFIKDNHVILEYFEPADAIGKGTISISTVVHGYRLIEKDFGDSGSCNNNVNCSVGDDWEDQIKSVAMVVLDDNTRWCSGALINNMRQDCRPYFLTAEHCLTGEDPGESTSWIFIFDYESPQCTPNTDGSLASTVQGGTVRAAAAASDFALIELDDNPAEFYDVYFSGWSRENTPSNNAVGIHHPAGDVKKISFEDDALVSASFSGTPNTHWRVTDWDDGTTEGGSSGSPLFDSNKRIVGQLSGGGAACGNNLEDDYGKIWYSWNQNGNTAGVSLQSWLDPDNIGLTSIDGQPCSSSPPVGNFVSNTQIVCRDLDNTVQFIDLSSLNPIAWFWTFEGGTPTNSTDQNPTVSYAQDGTYDVRLIVFNDFGIDTIDMVNFIEVVSGADCPCFDPSEISVDNITAESATVSWEVGSTLGQSWTIEYGPTGFALGTGTTVAAMTNAQTLTGLTANTNYDIYLTEDCAVNGESGVIGPVNFKTACIAACTYELNLFTSFVFAGWGGASLNFFVDGELDSIYTIEFGEEIPNKSFDIEVCKGSTISLEFVSGFVDEEVSYELIGPDGNTIFEDGPLPNVGGAYSTISCPVCSAPTLLTVDNVTDNSAVIDWLPNNEDALGWNVEYGIKGFNLGTGTSFFVSEESLLTLANLAENTIYDVYVNEICEADEFSSFIGPASFNTKCSGITCTYTLDLFDSFGDGWNGAELTVFIDDKPTGPYSVSVGQASTASFDIQICQGSNVTLSFASGAFDEEIEYQLFDNDGNLIFEDGPNPTIGVSFNTIANCSNCSLIATAGAISQDLQYICADESTDLIATDVVLDTNYKLGYVIHSGENDILGEVFKLNTVGQFNRQDVPNTLTTYYVSPIVGFDNNNDGLPDVVDECTIIAKGTPVSFLNPIEIISTVFISLASNTFQVEVNVAGGYTQVEAGDYQVVVNENLTATVSSDPTETTLLGPIENTGNPFSFIYTVDVTDNLGCTKRFSEVQTTTLPIDLLSFTGEALTTSNQLKWVTASETNNDHFILEHATNGIDFEAIGEIAGKVNSQTVTNYTFEHKQPARGVNYYRLTQVDMDNTPHQLPIVVRVDRGEIDPPSIVAAPVPSQQFVQIDLQKSYVDKVVNLKVYDITGRLVHEQSIDNTNGANDKVQLTIDTYAKGVYFVAVTDGKIATHTKFIKQ